MVEVKVVPMGLTLLLHYRLLFMLYGQDGVIIISNEIHKARVAAVRLSPTTVHKIISLPLIKATSASFRGWGKLRQLVNRGLSRMLGCLFATQIDSHVVFIATMLEKVLRHFFQAQSHGLCRDNVKVKAAT